FESFNDMSLDKLTAAEWIRSMPESFRRRLNAPRVPKAIRQLADRFAEEQASGTISRINPMENVIELIDIYSRASLGATTAKVSAMVFANVYISELETRYTWRVGTGQAAHQMEQRHRARENLIALKTSASTSKLTNTPSGVQVDYWENGQV